MIRFYRICHDRFRAGNGPFGQETVVRLFFSAEKIKKYVQYRGGNRRINALVLSRPPALMV